MPSEIKRLEGSVSTWCSFCYQEEGVRAKVECDMVTNNKRIGHVYADPWDGSNARVTRWYTKDPIVCCRCNGNDWERDAVLEQCTPAYLGRRLGLFLCEDCIAELGLIW